MLILRSLRNLTKLSQNHVVGISPVTNKRELRGLPRQRDEFEAQKVTSSTQQKSVATEHGIQNGFELAWNEAVAPTAKQNHKREDLQVTTESETDSQLTDHQEATYFVPTFNLAAYVNKSHTLQQLIHLGVDLNSIERRKGLAEFVLRLDFDKDVKPYLLFLQDQGVPAEAFGKWVTKNPLIFKVDFDDLQTRVNYLEAKKFTPKQTSRIITKNPHWLMFSTRRIDRRLGHFQQEFHLSGDDVRFLSAKQPRLITYNMDHIRKSSFCIREEMGFDADEIKCLLLAKPRLWMAKSDELIERFAYAHQEMELSHNMLIQFPEVLTSREFRLRQRHEFLKMLRRAQYDPEKDLYISPKALVEGTEHDFVRNVAKVDMKTYELFLKTR